MRMSFPFAAPALILPLAMPAYVMAYAYTDWLQFSGPVQSALRAATGAFPPVYPVLRYGSLLGSAMQMREPTKSLALIVDPRVQRPELVQRLGLTSALIAPRGISPSFMLASRSARKSA